MKWQKVSDYAVLSPCRKFTIALLYVDSVKRVELWRRATDDQPAEMMGFYATAAEAKGVYDGMATD